MTTYLTNLDGGKTDQQGHNHFNNNAFSGGVLKGFVTKQNSPLGMNVLVEEGVASVPYSNYAFDVWSDADETVTVETADPSNPRIDRLVLYVDRSETPQTVNPNNPGITKFKLVKGTPASSPNRPTNANVNTAVSNNPWIDLADIRVNAGVTQITNANITDKREQATLSPNTVDTNTIADSAVTAEKIDWATLGARVTNIYPNFYQSPSYNMTAGDSVTDTITLPRPIEAGERVLVIPTSQFWCVVTITTHPTTGSTVSIQRNCVVSTVGLAYKLSVIYYVPN